jgi:hypothetical protein
VYTLEITEDTSRATYTPRGGDSYVLTIYTTDDGVKISTGTVGPKSTSTNIVLQHKDGDSVAITVTADGGITDISADIPVDVGSPQPKPGPIVAAPPVFPAVFHGTWLDDQEGSSAKYVITGSLLTFFNHGGSYSAIPIAVAGPAANVDEDTKDDYPDTYHIMLKVSSIDNPNNSEHLPNEIGMVATFAWDISAAPHTKLVFHSSSGKLDYFVQQ